MVNKDKKKQHKLLIKFIFKPSQRFKFKKQSFPVQNKPFNFGLSIKNFDKKIFPGATIKNFEISSLEQESLNHNFEEEFSIRSLNPDEGVEVWWPNAMSTCLEGLVWLSCSLIPNNPEHKIISYQQDRVTGSIDKYRTPNSWGDASYIERKFELEQSRTNFWVAVLTLLTFLEGVFGLKEIATSFLKLLQWIFLFLASALGKLY